jgi:DNA polymerase
VTARRTSADEAHDATPYVPDTRSITRLAAAADDCRGCPLWANATQSVFGRGPRRARLFLVGEQPGDREDRDGAPFVGPAGRVLRQLLEATGIDLDDVYLTNAVKHFKHEVRGKRRLHKKPNSAEIEACHPWLDAELDAVSPAVVVALGATAARSLLGTTIGIAANREATLEVRGRVLVVTYHPSAVLRSDSKAEEVRRAIADDLSRAAGLAGIR